MMPLSGCPKPTSPMAHYLNFERAGSLLRQGTPCNGLRYEPSGGLLEQQQPRGSVGDRDVIVAMQAPDLPGERTAHRQPHDELGTLAAGALDDVVDRETGERQRVAQELFDPQQVEIPVDEPGPLPIQLVREATGAYQHHP